MNGSFRTVSALLRHTWLIEESYAHAHESLINAYLSGQYPTDENDKVPHAQTLSYVIARDVTHEGATRSETGMPGRYETADPGLPDKSVLIVTIQGAMMRDGFCGTGGSMQYADLINEAYANDKIVGTVLIVDSPGGQVAGISTLCDAVSNPAKPVVALVQEGTAASAAYWAICGADYIMATQQTDQIGSIGVMVRLRDTTAAEATEGVKTMTVYSRRSTEKNKPYRDALAGDTTALEDELDQVVDFFEAAVVAGRGDRLKPVKKNGTDVFQGGLFYAGKAIELGLIDSYGDINAAIDKVYELAAEREASVPPAPATNSLGATIELPGQSDTPPLPVSETPANQTTNQINSPMSLFGYKKLVALAAITGIAADAITSEQVSAINDEFQAGGLNVAVISQADFEKANALGADLATANARNVALAAEVARLGLQPGALPTQAEKTTETTATTGDTVISETDAKMKKMLAAMPEMPKAA